MALQPKRTSTCTTAKQKDALPLKNEINESITDIEQIDANHYFIGTDVGIHYAELKNNKLMLSPATSWTP